MVALRQERDGTLSVVAALFFRPSSTAQSYSPRDRATEAKLDGARTDGIRANGIALQDVGVRRNRWRGGATRSAGILRKVGRRSGRDMEVAKPSVVLC